MVKTLTVGELKKALKDVPDELEIRLSSDTGVDQGEGEMIQINVNGQINDYAKGSSGRGFLSLNGVSFPADY